MSTSLQQLRDIFYGILREEEDSTAYPLTLCDLYLNVAQKKICNWQVTNPFTSRTIRKGQLSFLNVDVFYSNVQSTTLSADVAVWDTTLTVWSTTDFPATGTLFIAGNVIPYTAKTSTPTITFTVSNVDFAFQSGTQVSICYALPSDYASVVNVVYKNGMKVEPKLYDDIFEDLNSIKWWWYDTTYNTVNTYNNNSYYSKPFYTIKDGAYLVLFNCESTGNIIRLRYTKKPTTMTSDGYHVLTNSFNDPIADVLGNVIYVILSSTSYATIDDDEYAKTTIPYLAVAEMLYNRGEEERAAQIYNFATWSIKDMYGFYNDATYEEISWTQYKMGKGRVNI